MDVPDENQWRWLTAVLGAVCLLVFSGSLLVVEGTTPALAANNTTTPNVSVMSYEKTLDNTISWLKLILRYTGVTFTTVGAVIWMSAKKSARRGRWGLWMTISGVAMVLTYFAFPIMQVVIYWILS